MTSVKINHVSLDDEILGRIEKRIRTRLVLSNPPPAVLAAPLTRQGVRNLDSAAPAHLRNGRKFRRPKNYEVICEHKEESRDPQTKTRTVTIENERGESTFEQEYEVCLDCGSEVSL
jgi:hypothetical protein